MISLYQKLADACMCGLCNEIDATRMSEYTCSVCGRIICKRCYMRWGRCKDHPMTCCGTEVIGTTRWNYVCGVCGNGTGSAPDPYYKWLEEEE